MALLPAKEQKVNRVTKGLAMMAALLPLVAIPTARAATSAPVPPLPSPATVLTLSPFSYPGGNNKPASRRALRGRPHVCARQLAHLGPAGHARS